MQISTYLTEISIDACNNSKVGPPGEPVRIDYCTSRGDWSVAARYSSKNIHDGFALRHPGFRAERNDQTFIERLKSDPFS